MTYWTNFIAHAESTIFAIKIAFPFLLILICSELFWPGQKLVIKTSIFNLIYTPVFLMISSITVSILINFVPKELLFGILNVIKMNLLEQIFYFILYLLLFDFGYYWIHRAQHSCRWLWRFHATHHSDCNVSALSASRHHWLEETFRFIPITLPMAIIFGASESMPMWALVAPGLYGIFIHWNCPLRMNYLQKIIVTPWYHRIHHSIVPDHENKNFAVFFPVWDLIFGTAYFPKKEEFPETGIVSDIHSNSFRRFLPWPKI